jgi:hypothetical protein
MTAGVIPRPHLPRDFSGGLIDGQDACLSFWSLSYRVAKTFSEKPVPTLQANISPSGLGEPTRREPKYFRGVFGQGIAADHELLRLGDLEFNPGTTAPTALVE